MNNVGLVLEGGGMRGVFTGGVLDFFMDKNLYFNYVIGVSAGACNGASYVSRQKGRSKKINLDYINDPRYIGLKNIFTEKSLFGMNFLFDEIPNNLLPFDYETFMEVEDNFVITATDCETGRAAYYYKKNCKDINKVIRASSSLPFFSPIVEVEGKKLLDGGVADSIPIRQSIADGNSNNVIILTRNKGYIKQPFKPKFFSSTAYSKYKLLAKAIADRHIVYNETLRYIEKLEGEGTVFVIRPQEKIRVRRTEKDVSKLTELYNEGYREASLNYEGLMKWLKEKI